MWQLRLEMEGQFWSYWVLIQWKIRPEALPSFLLRSLGGHLWVAHTYEHTQKLDRDTRGEKCHAAGSGESRS